MPTVPSPCPGMGARGAGLGDEGMLGSHPALVQWIYPLVTGSRELGYHIPMAGLARHHTPAPSMEVPLAQIQRPVPL